VTGLCGRSTRVRRSFVRINRIGRAFSVDGRRFSVPSNRGPADLVPAEFGQSLDHVGSE
jgi:hypothetical protein